MNLRKLSLPAAALAGCAAVIGCVVVTACSDEIDTPRALPGETESRVAASESRDDADAGEAELAIPAGSPVVVFLGDSIAAGLHLAASESFPGVVQRKLADDGLPFTLINAGVSGDTSAGGLRRIDWQLANNHPDIVVIELGGNDGLRGQSIDAIETNLRAIVRKAKDAGARVLLLGMLIPPSYGLEYARDFEALYARIAKDEETAFVPRFMSEVGGRAKLNLEDGLHPNRAGHEKLAEALAPQLRELLGQLATQ